MNRAIRTLLVVLLTMSGALASVGVAHAAISNSTGTNVQSGDNRSTGNQGGASKSGDAVGGQVTGVVSSGRTSVDARNTSSNSDVTSGDARGTNDASSFTGLNATTLSTSIGGAADVFVPRADNLQDGSNTSTYTQSANYTTGDGVAGEVIGVVTAAGGSASIVGANTSTNDSVQTGDARGSNDYAAFTGLNESIDGSTTVADVTNSCNVTDGCTSVQNGNNRSTARQSSTANTGDGVAGQVIGAVSGGATSIDASNRSDGVDVTTGDARADNSASLFTGLNDSETTTVLAADVTNTCNRPLSTFPCSNVQDGDNRTNVGQNASSTTGDGVGGEVIGVVTSAGGSASVVAANTSTNTDITTGDATTGNDLAAFVGLDSTANTTTVAADLTGVCNVGAGCDNIQNGSNRLTGNQVASAATGDGVGGQVLGVVSAGAASLDATNHTDDSSVTTGDGDASNAASEFVGQTANATATVGPVGADISASRAVNIQDGSNRKTLSQTANATSGDGVAGQVSGVVTSAGGSASVVLANTSTSIDSTSGDTHFDNTDNGFVGQNDSDGPLTVV